jgi:phosphatidate cytidylyltransferase
LLLIWASDIGAYQLGKTFGRRKLWPDISPNKTIEGLLGGLWASTMVGICFSLWGGLGFSLGKIVLISVVVVIVGTFGDLVQSAFKRHYGVKDSGSILPGHGGVLDRFDSLMYTLPVLMIFGDIG